MKNATRVDRALLALSRGAARTLDPGERAVVLGDLAESQARPWRQLREITGLAARRQLGAWAAPGPWIAIALFALPLGILLSHVSRAWSDGSVVYLRAYVQGFSWTYVANPGSRQDLFELAAWFVSKAAALWIWSWTAGFALARLSCRTLWLTGAVFAVALFAATIGTWTTSRGILGHGLTASHFYGLVLPRLVRVGLVLLPAWLGARAARRAGRPALTRAVPFALAAVLFVAWTTRGVEAALMNYGRDQPWAGTGPDGTWGTEDDTRSLPLRAVPFSLAIPAVYIGAAALASRRARRLSACSGPAQER